MAISKKLLLITSKAPDSTKMLDITTDRGAYILGILWGTASFTNEMFWVRHRDEWYARAVKEALDLPLSVQRVFSRTGPQYRLKICRKEAVSALLRLLVSCGWSPRQALESEYPSRPINGRGFCRAWTELHSVLDWHRIYRKNRRLQIVKRLRIYGNRVFLEQMNYIICRETKLSSRKVQTLHNAITGALYFQGSSADIVLDWLYGGAELCSPTARERLCG